MKFATKLILLLLLSFSAAMGYAQPTFVGTTVTDPDANPPGTNPSVGSGNEFDYNGSMGIDAKIDIDPTTSRVTWIFGAGANFTGPATYRYIFSGGDLNAFTSITKNNTLSTKTDHAHMTASVSSKTITFSFDATGVDGSTGNIVFDFVATSTTPAISTTGTLSAFSTCSGTASAAQSFSVSGSNLTANISITPPSGFEVSTSATFASNVGNNGTPLTLTQSGGSVSSTTVYARLSTSATGTPSGNIAIASTGATTKNVAASGTVNSLPTITLGSVSSVSTSATSFSLPYSATTGSPNQYSITTGSPTAMAGFSAVSNTTLGASPISVTIPASSAATYNFNLTVKNSTTGCVSSANAFTVVVAAAGPTISITGTLSAVSTTYGTASATPTSFSVSGANMTNDITVTPPSGFEISKTSSSSGYGGSGGAVTLTNVSGTINATTIYLRLTATAAVGTYSGTISCTSTGATTATTATVSSTVSAKALTITANNVNKTYGVTITGAAGSTAFTATGLVNSETISTVTIAYGTGSAATAAVNTYSASVTPSAATGGSFTASNYTITYNTGSIIVGAAPLTVTANNVNKTYGVAITGAAGLTAFTATGLVNSETISTVTVAYGTGSAATAAVNTYSASVTPSAATGGTFTASNYTITYAKGNIIVGAASLIVTANNVNKTYGVAITGAAGSTAFTATGLVNSETISTVTVAYGTGSAATAAVNTYTGSVTPSAATGGTFTASNYSITYSTGNIIVGAAPLTVTANNVNKTYGVAITGAAGSTAFTVTGLVNSETISTVTVAYGTGSAATAAVNTYSASVTPSAAIGGTFTASNYTITYAKGNIIVGAAPLTVTANNVNKTYGVAITGAAGSTAFTVTGLVNSETISTVTVAYGTGSAATAAVNTYTGSVTPSAATGGTFTASNYSITYSTGNIIVWAAPLTVTANNVNKTYGVAITGAAGSTAFTVTGLVNSETISTVTIGYGTGSAATAAVNTYAGSVTPSAATGGTFTAGNYSITYSAGNIIVGAAPLTVTASDANRTYGETLTSAAGSSAFSSTGLQNSETIGSVTIGYATGIGNGNNATDAVGTYTGKITPSAATGGTFTAGNYTITYNTGNIIVGTAALTITATNQTKTVGTTATLGTSAFTVTGIKNSETVGSVTLSSTGAASSATVGTYPIVPSAATGGSFTSSNYTITYTNGTLQVAASTNANLSALSLSSGTLSPVFVSGTTSYAANVGNATSSVTVTPVVDEASATVTVNGTTVTSGTASGAIALSVGNNTVNIVVTAGDGTTTKTYTVTITRAAASASNNADLSALSTGSGTLSPGFASATTSYAVSVSASSITVTPTRAEATATITVNGTAVASGNASGAIALNVGNNTITIIVTAGDGTTTKTYTLTVNRAASSNADLSALVISSGTLTPSFASGTLNYTATVSNSTTSITVTPTSAEILSTITVNGITTTSGSASGAINLSVGSNTVTVKLTAQDGTTIKNYVLTITRSAAGASSNADLSGLAISSGTLTPVFASGTLDYTASVSNSTASITVTPTHAESTATITVNGIAVASGAASGAIALNVGNNIISVIVTAGDGATTKTYTLTVNRAASNNADLSGLVISSGTLTPSFVTGTLNYTATVSNSTASITVTPTSAEISSTITVNGITTTSGSASGAINLSVGSNTITVKVTAQDGTTIKNYVLTITRSAAAASNNANLSGLLISNGTLSPVFDGATTSYAVQVSDNINTVTITPTLADAGATIKVNNNTVASGSSSSAIAIPDDANTISIAVTAADGITVKTYTITITKPRTTWNGNASNVWTNAANWSNGVPDTIKLAVIPNVTTSPVVGTTEKVKNINLNTGAAITITSNLQVIGNMINNGTISGTGLLTFNGTLAQTISGTGIVGNITIDNSNGISVIAGNGNTLKISGILSMNNGTLTTNNNLVLRSDASGTASVAPILGSAVISGLVTVQRWIGVQRGYRAFGHPFNSALPLSQLSDNFSISGSGDGFVTGLGYSTASVTYYDSVATNPALFKKALSNAPNKSSTLSWSANRGILALVRGQGTEGLGGTYVSANQPSAFAADATGTLNQGTLSDYVLGANAIGTSFNLVGNPFAAPINIKLLKSNGGNPLYANNNAATGVGNTIYVYNPYKNAGTSSIPSQEVRGGLDAYTNDGNTDIIIPAFGAFFIQAKALGNVIRFDETVKAVSGIPVAVMGNGPATAKLNLEIVNDKGGWDDLKLRWDNKANAAGTDSYDGLKLNNELFDFYSLSSDNRKLCIDSRSDSFNREEIIPLGISTNVIGNSFRMKVSQYELPVNMRVYLRDKLLKTESLLSGTGDEYAFSITTDTATKGDNRFELSVKIAKQSIPTPDASSDALKILPNPFKDELVIRLSSNMVSATGNTNVRIIDMLGRVIKTVTADPNTSLIKLNTHTLASGIYVVEVVNDKNQITKQVIKQ